MAVLLSRKDKTRVLRLAVTGKPIQRIVDQVRARVLAHVAEAPALRERLAGRRYRILGADLHVEEPGVNLQRAVRHAEVSAYDYDRDVLVSAIVELATGEVIRVVDYPGRQPPPVPEEVAEAAALAAADPEVVRRLRGVRTAPVAINARGSSVPGPRRRVFELYFWTRAARPKRVAGPIFIDLSRRAVLRVERSAP
jgi:hypothetical protein